MTAGVKRELQRCAGRAIFPCPPPERTVGHEAVGPHPVAAILGPPEKHRVPHIALIDRSTTKRAAFKRHCPILPAMGVQKPDGACAILGMGTPETAGHRCEGCEC